MRKLRRRHERCFFGGSLGAASFTATSYRWRPNVEAHPDKVKSENGTRGRTTSDVRRSRRRGDGVMLRLALALLIASQAQSLDASEGSPNPLARFMLGRERAGFSGAVLVTRGPDVLLREGYGFADLELGVRNTPETVFRIGSVTKPLVATAVLRLVARDRLNLDDPLLESIQNVPKRWRQVTIEDLLSHTSGIPDLFGEVASGPPSELRALLDDTLHESEELPLRSEPGSQYSYSNFGYLILAYVIEVADG
ncbi:MAG: serine hydrolase domain-containing protein, partial [Thermoanaerobaculia bacterium]